MACDFVILWENKIEKHLTECYNAEIFRESLVKVFEDVITRRSPGASWIIVNETKNECKENLVVTEENKLQIFKCIESINNTTNDEL